MWARRWRNGNLVHGWRWRKMGQPLWEIGRGSLERNQRITIWSSTSTPRYPAKKTQHRNTNICTYATVHCIVHSSHQARTEMSVNRGSDQMWHTHTTAPYSALERKEVLTDAEIQMSLEGTMSVRDGQMVRDHSPEVPRTDKWTEAERVAFTSGEGGRTPLHSRAPLCWGDGKALEMDSFDGCTTLGRYKTYTLKNA